MADACERCGSTRFYIDNGIRYCSNGHEQAGGQQVAEADEEYLTQGRRTKRKKEKRPVKASKIYRGHLGYKLFLQAYQHVLWRQCYALIHKKDLPPELWTVVRDLWTLRLAKQADRLEKSAGLEEGQPSVSAPTETSDESESEASTELQVSGKKGSDAPVLVETLALCYLGILLMRLPVSIGDIYRWMKSEDIPYFRAIRHVPPEMVTHLPGEYQGALDTVTILSPDGLQSTIYRLCTLYTTEFGMSLPALNCPPLLFQYMKQLALPLEIYPAVKSLNRIVKFTFIYCPASELTTRRTATSHPEAQLISLVVIATKLLFPFDSDVARRYPRSLSEPAAQRMDWTKWMALREDVGRRANTSNQGLGDGTPRVRPPLLKGQEVNITDTDIFHMSGAELDRYMDWYQQTWIEPPKHGSVEDSPSKEIQGMFPLAPLPAEDSQRDPEGEVQEARLKVVREVHATMKMSRVVSDEEAKRLQEKHETEHPVEIKRPGEGYQVYARVEEVQLETAKAFYDAAAEAACMSVERLVKAVRQTETKLEVWRGERRRAERWSEQGHSGKEEQDTKKVERETETPQ